MAIPMTSLTRAKNGDWFARKAIPEALRESYKAAFGVSQEERFRRPASISMGQAKQELRDWDAEITGRIERLRAQGTGAGLELTYREALGLAGKWYGWFIARHEPEPGSADGWDLLLQRLEDAYSRFAPATTAVDENWADHPNVRRHVRGQLSELASVATFLAEIRRADAVPPSKVRRTERCTRPLPLIARSMACRPRQLRVILGRCISVLPSIWRSSAIFGYQFDDRECPVVARARMPCIPKSVSDCSPVFAIKIVSMKHKIATFIGHNKSSCAAV